MFRARYKQFQTDVKETMKATKDSYLVFGLVLLVFIALISLVVTYFQPFFIIPLLFLAVGPFLLALISYFVAPSKQALEQKQTYFFRLVRQYYRLDSLRVIFPIRNLILSGLISYALGSLTIFIALLIGAEIDPALQAFIAEYTELLQSEATMEQLDLLINNHIEVINAYLPYFVTSMTLGFLSTFTYLTVKRFFFVLLHVNLFSKTKYKVEAVKQKYYNGPFYQKYVRHLYFMNVAPVFLISLLAFIGTTFLAYFTLGAQFNILQIMIGASAIFLIILILFIPYFASVNLVLFGQFMELYAIDIYQISIDDIVHAINNPNLSNQEKENLMNIKQMLEHQKQFVINEQAKNKPESNESN